jgi:multiple sugar transport system ATP-binding protein
MADVKLKQVCKSYLDGTVAVQNLNLEIKSGEFLSVLGPSGCGKSSTLRMIAGLEDVTNGAIDIDGRNVVDLPARERDIAMVFENYALYPHLNVFDNIAMPLLANKTPKAELNERVCRIADTLAISPHLKTRPHLLSGGQRQRVALARAMVRRPRMFLMDEPLGHLEAYLRLELRREIRALHEETGGTTFYITHDQEEAAAVSDRIAVMSEGELQQVGTIRELIDNPSNRFVAEFVGEPPITIFEGISIRTDGLHMLGLHLQLPAHLQNIAERHGPSALGVRPEHFTLAPASRTGLAARVQSVQPMGEWAAILCDTPAGPASVVAATSDLPRKGESVNLVLDAARLHLFAADGRNLTMIEE